MTTPYAEEGFVLQLLAKAVAAKASDIHLKVGQPPGARVRGDMVFFKTDRLTPEDTAAAARVILGPNRVPNMDDLREYDCSYQAPVGRFRVNVYKQRGSVAAVLRHIPTEVPPMESLGLPTVTRDLAEKKHGMVLLVGATGNGKTTSLAAMIAHLNHTKQLHIVTIEDPIEFIHVDKSSSISQREVGIDTPNFALALRASLRQNPDVIFLGEIRDGETMDTALKAAETGHLVLSTLHTPDTVRTVNRMLALMEGDVTENRHRIASALQGVIAQKLLPRADRPGMILAAEVLVASHSVREAIKQPEKNPPIKALMEKNAHTFGMQTFQMHLEVLKQQGIIDEGTFRETLGI